MKVTYNLGMIKNTNIWQNFIDISERAILMIIAVATLYATGIEIHRLIVEQVVTLSDLFLLFILLLNSKIHILYLLLRSL